MAHQILFQRAHIVDPVTGLDTIADLLVTDGVITAIGGVTPGSDAHVVDMHGRLLLPGFCDMHVHLREPGQEYKETIASGAAAAAAGGFTAIACMPNTTPAIDTPEVVASVLAKARDLVVDVHPIAAITRKREGRELSPMAELVEAGAVAFSDDGSPVADAGLMRIAMEYAGMFNVPVIQHAEESSLAGRGVMHEGFHSTLFGLPGIPSIAEETMISRDVAIAEYVKTRYHVAHISTAGSAAIVRAAKRAGLPVTCEVTPHHFTLTDAFVGSYDTNTKMNPPLRSADDVQAMKEALRDGTIDAIATDHAPHATFEKEVEFVDAPFGIIGLETAVGLAMTELVVPGWLTIEGLVRVMSTNPRRILALPEIRIEVGQPANLTLIDPETTWTVDAGRMKSLSRNTPFHGTVLQGRPMGILNTGTLLTAE